MATIQTRIALSALCTALLAAGCAGTKRDTLQNEGFGRVTITRTGGTLGESVRQIGEECNGGLVLMRGVEQLPLGILDMSRATFQQLAEELTEQTGLTYEETPDYYFLYPPGYENVTAVTVTGKLDPAFAALRTGVSFGARTRLYNALGVMSHNLGKTILADNLVAESECGELFISDAPLGAVLEALFKSARVYPEAILVESTPDYVFIHSVQNPPGAAVRIATDDAPPEMEEALARRVSVYLPERPATEGGLQLYKTAVPLERVLAPLSEQTGIPVFAGEALHDLPVNFCVLKDMPVSTVLELLIRQWPLDVFGYEVHPDGIHIVQR